VKVSPAAQLRREMAFIAYHFHWDRKELLLLEHAERRGWCEEISRINRELDGTPPNPFDNL